MMSEACPGLGCNRNIKRNGLGTCGRQKCIQHLQTKILRGMGQDPKEDKHDPGHGAKVKVDGGGSAKTVNYTKRVRGTDCVVLNDGTTIPVSRVEFQ